MILRGLIVLLASVGPLVFPIAQLGYASLHDLALFALLPSIAGLIAIGLAAQRRRPDAAAIVWRGAMAGAVATLALEAVRYSGFRLGFMPGNLPQLMGVLLLDRFALGPSAASDVAGVAYHFWNGAAFGIIFVALTGGRSVGLAIAYGLVVGVGFLGSPVVQSPGVGPFKRDFNWHFAATVLTAHAAFGATLGALLVRGRLSASLKCQRVLSFEASLVKAAGDDSPSRVRGQGASAVRRAWEDPAGPRSPDSRRSRAAPGHRGCTPAAGRCYRLAASHFHFQPRRARPSQPPLRRVRWQR